MLLELRRTVLCSKSFSTTNERECQMKKAIQAQGEQDAIDTWNNQPQGHVPYAAGDTLPDDAWINALGYDKFAQRFENSRVAKEI